MHPPYDGSLHLAVPGDLAAHIQGTGWGTPAEPEGSVLVFAPRDVREMEQVWKILLASHRQATGWPSPADG
ncbi:luciferase domain-containing protein [Streptomyces umbrinus]